MLQGWVVVAVALAYIGLLFVVASYGDRVRVRRNRSERPLIYPLSLAIYCTSWTFFGSVGLASRTGFDFLTIYIGPILMIGLGWPLIMRIVRLAKAQNITSVADFVAARYGKAQAVAATVAVISIVGTIPYIALQLKAVSSSLHTVLAQIGPTGDLPVFGDLSLFVALSMAAFAVLFGTRHTDATEHQDGLMLAVATEFVVKLVAFLAVGIFVTFWMFDGPAALFSRAMADPTTVAVLTRTPDFGTFASMTLLALFAIVLLPRQFHVTVVENNNQKEIRRAAWLFPTYLVLINLFVVPIALAGLLTFGSNKTDGDMFMLALPAAAGSQIFTLIAFIGGLSAATAMVIVETVALAVMVSNDIVVPLILKRRETFITDHAHVGWLLLATRRIAIFAILVLAYMYYRSAGDAQLASIGLLSFAAVAQLAPAFFGSLIWRRGTARGAMAGMTLGFATWAYTLFLPSFADAGITGAGVLIDGPFGLAWLRPQGLFGVDLPPLVHGVCWSLALNLLAYVGFSFGRAPTAIERVQADVFVPPERMPLTPTFRLRRSSVTVEELTATVARYLGEERTRASFESYAAARGLALEPKSEADFQFLQHAEHLLASAIGAASSRLVLSLLLSKRAVSTRAALKLLDDANAAIHYNREVLQTALDHVRQGIAIFNSDLRLIFWNHQFADVLDLPPSLVHVGTGLDEILRFSAARRTTDPGEVQDHVQAQIARYVSGGELFLERIEHRGLVVEVRANHMPDGGLVTTFTDITPSVAAAEQLERANETLEKRVRDRTEQLTLLNAELERAKASAEQANLSKTHFLAAASHDILQPLNAARLYVTSLTERQGMGPEPILVSNIDASLEAVEEIIGALLDISRLDAGALKPDITRFRVDEFFSHLEVEFAPMAKEKGLDLRFVPSALTISSDRRLLRRLLQNLISNAIKYTAQGKVLVGCRRKANQLRIDVYDTGLGIPQSKHAEIFLEFHRLEQGVRAARGLGLGLSIVERIARVLNHQINMSSTPGHGSHFSVDTPIAPAAALRHQSGNGATADRGQLHGLTVLCIDNDPAILDGMKTLLTGWGCSVRTASDLATATAATTEHNLTFDALIVDYHLDAGTGVEVVVDLRRRVADDVAAILITADRSPEVREQARNHAIQVLYKPVKPAALRALLAQSHLRRIAAAE